MVMFRMIYGEQHVLTQCRDFNILFQVYGLALKYMLSVELATDVMMTIDVLEVSPATVVSALETVLDFKDLDGFEELTKDLVQKVVGNITIATVLPALQVAVRFQAGVNIFLFDPNPRAPNIWLNNRLCEKKLLKGDKKRNAYFSHN